MSIEKGTTGKSVEALQIALGGLLADGIFGSATEQAVRRFQERHGLQVDGIAGPETMRALLGGAGWWGCVPEAPETRRHAMPENKGVPFAVNTGRFWPVRTNHRKGRRVTIDGARGFKASRSNGKRYHCGVDLYGKEGDIIVATESGTIASIYPFYRGTYALIFQTDSGTAINFGEIKAQSWLEFGAETGDIIKEGSPIARVGKMRVSSMLHFETYTRGTKRNRRWFQNGPPPRELLDPTQYLIHLAQVGV